MSVTHLKKTVSKTSEVPLAENTEKKKLDAHALGQKVDTLSSESRLIDNMIANAHMSTWVRDYRMPDKATLETSYEESMKAAFGNVPLMESHQSKRKSNYMEKAKYQTSAASMIDAAYKERLQARQAFLEEVPHVEMAEEDVSFMQDWSAYRNTGEFAKGQLGYLGGIFSEDEEQRMSVANSFADEILASDITVFEYKNDKDFLSKFKDQYKKLCAFANSQKIIDMLDDGVPSERICALRAKVAALNDIREDYENRMQIMQSPYYALLMESDLEDEKFEKLKEEALKNNPVAARYFEALDKKEKLRFSKGKSANEIMLDHLKEDEDFRMIQAHKDGMSGLKEFTRKADLKSEEKGAPNALWLKQEFETFSDGLFALFKEKVPADSAQAEQKLTDISRMYKELNSGLDHYVGGMSGKQSLSKSEQQNLELARKLSVQYQNEQKVFELAAARMKDGSLVPGDLTWESVLYNIRAEYIDLNSPEVEVHGGGASTVYRTRLSDGKVAFVKKETKLVEDIDHDSLFDDAVKNGDPMIGQMINRIREYVRENNLPEAAYNAIVVAIRNSMESLAQNIPQKLPDEATEEQKDANEKAFAKASVTAIKEIGMLRGAQRFWDNFIMADMRNYEAFRAMAVHANHKFNEYDAATGKARLDSGANISDRNVSTSIVASRLGVSNIVAASKTILLDNGDGTYMRANAMEEVAGVEFGVLVKEAQKQKCRIEYTPEAMGQLFSLQVLDMICGQVDRHSGNFMVTEYDRQKVTVGDQTSEVWVVKSIKGIDNDLSFGKMNARQMMGTDTGFMTAFNVKGIESGMIKFLPASFVELIHSYSDLAKLKADLGDTRSEEEIRALYDRIVAVGREIDDRVASKDPKQMIRLYSKPEELLAIHKELQEDGTFASIKAEAAPIFEMVKGVYIDWDSVRDTPADPSEIRETIEEKATLKKKKKKEDNAEKERGAFIQGHEQMMTMTKELLESKVTHMFVTYSDSDTMDQVKSSLRTLDHVLRGQVQKGEGFADSIKPVLKAYTDVISYCEAYIAKTKKRHAGKRSVGARRLELTEQILEQCRNEHLAFSQMTAANIEVGEMEFASSFTDLLYSARAVKLSVTDRKVSVIGAGSSKIYRLEENDGSTQYVKEAEKVLPDENTEAMIKAYIESGGKAQKEFGAELLKLIKVNLYDFTISYTETFTNSALMNLLWNIEDGETEEEFKEKNKVQREKTRHQIADRLAKQLKIPYIDEHMDQFYDFICYFFKRDNETYHATSIAAIKVGEEISSRNVSTSRVAKRLNLTDMVAESKTVVMEREDHSFAKANSMEGVETRDMSDLQIYSYYTKKKITLTPNALKQMCSLQIFDLICGQVDRHTGNYSAFYEETETELIVRSIKAIDNDMSFGLLRDGTQKDQQKDITEQRLPFLDKDTYERIMAYTPEQIRHDQADIRSDEEIDALISRIQYYQGILPDLVKSKEVTLCSTEDDWEDALELVQAMSKEGSLGYGYLKAHQLF